MLRLARVGAAGALGARWARYWIGTAIGVRSFPWATLAINVLGSFLLGFVLGGPGAGRWSPTTTTAVSVGFLGAFTTFSTLAFEATSPLRDDRTSTALSLAKWVQASGRLHTARMPPHLTMKVAGFDRLYRTS